MSTNICTFCGRLTANPEITTLPNGKERARFNVAVDRNYKKNDGTRPCDFFQVVKWGSAEYLRVTHLGKGDKVIVSGRMEQNEWQDSDGLLHKDKVLNCENIELVAKKRSDKDKAANDTASAAEQGTFNESDDDLPF
jgi:single-strand DNA-binding protein